MLGCLRDISPRSIHSLGYTQLFWSVALGKPTVPNVLTQPRPEVPGVPMGWFGLGTNFNI